MPASSEILDTESLRAKIIGLGEKSIRKSYYPELQRRIEELEFANRRLTTEIAEHKASEEELRDTNEKYHALFNTMTEIVIIQTVVRDDSGKPVDLRVLECNGAFLRIAGREASKTIGKLSSEIFHLSEIPYLEEVGRVAEGGDPFVYEEWNRALDKHFTISVVSPKRDVIASIATDVTDLSRAMDLLCDKNRELENYLYIASHDLRSPLVNIQGFSVRLSRQMGDLSARIKDIQRGKGNADELVKPLEENIPRSLQFILANVQKMDRLINALLSVSRTGRLTLNVASVDMNALVKNILDSFAFQIEQAGARIVLSDLPSCFGDENLLNQLFSNLIANALKYRDPARPLTVTVSGAANSRTVQYCVEDTGIGMDDKHLPRIWDVFFRVEWDGETQGDGIGLSIVKMIAEKHQGSVSVKSTKGRGSAFTVEIPAVRFGERT